MIQTADWKKEVSRGGAKPRREEFNNFVFFAPPRLRVKKIFQKE
jgi:hypothetical protein